MSGREKVLALLRAARREAGGAGDEQAREEVARRIASPVPVGPRPVAGGAERVARFVAKAEAVQVEVARLPSMRSLPVAIATALRDRNLPAAIRMGTEPVFAKLDWSGLDATIGTGRPEEPAALSRAAFGVAETGSLVFLSGPDNPVTLTFAGDHHFVALRESDVMENFEEVWEGIRTTHLDPRTVNFVTGPSRSADIEQRLELGAHGPVSLQVFLVSESG